MELTPIGHTRIELESVSSTNNYAMHLLEKQDIEEGTVIMTGYQTKGKGQDKNQWLSEKGSNLLLSVIFYPDFMIAAEQFILNKVLSLAIHDFIKQVLKTSNSAIKWPNDIYVDQKKIAGILVQNSIKGSNIEHTIAGMGINVNQDSFPDFETAATSLKLEKGEELDLKYCANILFKKIALRYHQLRSGARETIHWDYLHSLYRFHTWHNYKIGGREFKAKIIGVNEFGKLILEEKEGERLECDIKGIRFLPD